MNVHDTEAARLQKKNWISTASGRHMNPLDPRPEDVCIEDIAHALSQKCRFTGHTRFLYSVARHSVLVSQVVPPGYRLAGLLHDATEAYLPDIASPVKRHVSVDTPRWGRISFSELENHLADVIFEALGLSAIRSRIDSEEVKRGDLALLSTEVRDLMPGPLDDWRLTQPPADFRIQAVTPSGAREEFLALFNDLKDR